MICTDKIWLDPRFVRPADNCRVVILCMNGLLISTNYNIKHQMFNVSDDDTDSAIETKSIFAWARESQLYDIISRQVDRDYDEVRRRYYDERL